MFGDIFCYRSVCTPVGNARTLIASIFIDNPPAMGIICANTCMYIYNHYNRVRLELESSTRRPKTQKKHNLPGIFDFREQFVLIFLIVCERLGGYGVRTLS